VSKTLEWIGHTLLSILCLFLCLISLWIACIFIKGSKDIWDLDFNDLNPPLSPDAPAFDIFVGWLLPFFAWAMKLLVVGLCMPMMLLISIVGVFMSLIAAIMVMVGME
jgi:hypothetical protein